MTTNPSSTQRSIRDEIRLSNHQHNMSLRSWFGKAFVVMYCLFFITTAGIWVYSVVSPTSAQVSEIKEMIMTISALFSGPIGIIIGYFFGGERDKP